MNRSFAGILFTLNFDHNSDHNFSRNSVHDTVRVVFFHHPLFCAYNVETFLQSSAIPLKTPSRPVRIVEVTGSNPVCSTPNPAFRCRNFLFFCANLQESFCKSCKLLNGRAQRKTASQRNRCVRPGDALILFTVPETKPIRFARGALRESTFRPGLRGQRAWQPQRLTEPAILR